MNIKQLRIEAAQAGIPLTTILNKARIGRKTYYNWISGIYSPSKESMGKFKSAIDAVKKLRFVMDEMAQTG